MEDFDKIARDWDEKGYRQERADALFREIKKRVQLSRDMHVLDFGAGTGLLTLPIAAGAARVTAVDTSDGMLTVLNKKIHEAGIENIAVVNAGIGSETLPRGGFDLIVSSMTLHHIDDVAAILRRFRELLAPGGKTALADLDAEEGDFHADPKSASHHGFNREDFRGLLESAGFAGISFSTAYTMRKIIASGREKEFTLFLAVAEKK